MQELSKFSYYSEHQDPTYYSKNNASIFCQPLLVLACIDHPDLYHLVYTESQETERELMTTSYNEAYCVHDNNGPTVASTEAVYSDIASGEPLSETNREKFKLYCVKLQLANEGNSYDC